MWLLWRSDRSCSVETADKYVGKVRKWLSCEHGLDFRRTALHSEFVAKLSSYPREKSYADPATRRLLELCAGDTVSHPAVVAAAVVAWNGMFRPGELLPRRDWAQFTMSTLLTEDVQQFRGEKAEGYRTAIKCGKADKYNLGPYQYFVRRPGDPLCPVAAIERVLAQRPPPQRGQPFFAKQHGPALRLVLAEDITELYRRHAAAAGLDPAFLSAKSNRSGGATHVLNNGGDQVLIMQHARWSQRGTNEVFVLYQRATEEQLLRISAAYAGPTTTPLPAARRRLNESAPMARRDEFGPGGARRRPVLVRERESDSSEDVPERRAARRGRGRVAAVRGRSRARPGPKRQARAVSESDGPESPPSDWDWDLEGVLSEQ